MHKATNIEMSQSEIQALTKMLESLQEQVSEIATSQNDLSILIAGNRKYDNKDRGMIGRLEKVERFQEKAVKYLWMFVGGAFVVGFVLPYLWQWFLNKH